MPKLIRRTKSLREEVNQELMAAKVEKQEALIDYIAMMADVEIPEDEEEMLNEQAIRED